MEFVLLRRTLNKRIGEAVLPASFLVTLWLSALAAASVAFAVKLAIGARHPLVTGSIALGVYGAIYLASTLALGIPQARALLARVKRR